MDNFTRYIPTHFVFGKGVESETGKYVRQLGGTRVLIHYGGGSALRSGLIDRIEKSLDAENITHVRLGGVKPNPRDDLIYQGIDLVRSEKVDFILGVGGGSAIDSAKAIALGAVYDGDFWDFYTDTNPVTPSKVMPLGVVLTMSATGSESSNSSVITQDKTLLKRGLRSELNRPLLAIMNPELTMTLPPYQIACGAIDILAHIMERYFTITTDVDLTDRLCEGAMMAVIRSARIAVNDPYNYDAQSQLMWSSTIAHNDTLSVGRQSDFGSHKIEHELSALYDVAHGAGLAVVFPAWMRFHYAKHVDRFAQFAVRVWNCQMDFQHPEKTALAGIEAYEAFVRELGLPLTLKELGARSEDIPLLAAKTKRGADGLVGSCYKVNTQEIEEILRIADR